MQQTRRARGKAVGSVSGWRAAPGATAAQVACLITRAPVAPLIYILIRRNRDKMVSDRHSDQPNGVYGSIASRPALTGASHYKSTLRPSCQNVNV